MNKQSYDLLEGLLREAQNLEYKDGNLDKTTKRAEMLAKKVFGSNTEYVKKLDSIRYSPTIAFSGMDKSIYNSSFQSGKKQLVNLISVMLEDVSLTIPEEISEAATLKQSNEKSSSIFLVHGHNEEMKQAAARFLEKIGLKPIILHEQPNQGRTIIEKFTDYANVQFAVVLLSADDVAFEKSKSAKNGRLRARQNVILELGFFLGKIGRQNVVVLHEQIENFEFPSDYQGVLYEPYDLNGNWKLSIAKELKASGYNIDGNRLLE